MSLVKRRALYTDGLTEYTVHDSTNALITKVSAVHGSWWLCDKCQSGSCSHTQEVDRALESGTVEDVGVVPFDTDDEDDTDTPIEAEVVALPESTPVVVPPVVVTPESVSPGETPPTA